MWLLSGASEDSEDETVIEMHGTDVQYYAVRRFMHALRNAAQDI